MTASLLMLLESEKELVNHLDELNRQIDEMDRKRNSILSQKSTTEWQLKQRRSMIASYIEKNMIRYPNHIPTDPSSINKATVTKFELVEGGVD